MRSTIKALVMVLAIYLCPPAVLAQEVTEDTTVEEIHPIAEEEWTPEARLWLARSVLGEAGWARPDEYTAIAFVYTERAAQSKRFDFLGMVKRYSSAVKKQGKSRSPWLFQLKTGAEVLTRPKAWPTGPQWKGLRDQAWAAILEWADEWYAGKRPNTCPGANHYGGYVDRHRAKAKRWTRVKCEVKTRNRFYTSLKLVSKRRLKSHRW